MMRSYPERWYTGQPETVKTILGIQVPTQGPASMVNPINWLESLNWAFIGPYFGGAFHNV
jgi:hypothetical protein